MTHRSIFVYYFLFTCQLLTGYIRSSASSEHHSPLNSLYEYQRFKIKVKMSDLCIACSKVVGSYQHAKVAMTATVGNTSQESCKSGKQMNEKANVCSNH